MANYEIKLAVCIILLVTPFSTCVNGVDLSGEVNYDYYIKLISDNQQPYTLYVPIPLHVSMSSGERRPSKITSHIQVVEGNRFRGHRYYSRARAQDRRNRKCFITRCRD